MRAEEPEDYPVIRSVHMAAFRGVAEAVFADRLRKDGLGVASFVAVERGLAIGHILFSRLTILSPTMTLNAVAVAPLAVLPEHQGQGVGSALVRHGLSVCRTRGERIAIVLGDPRYCRRFGFSATLARNLRGPFEGEAFMALELEANALKGITGELRCSPAFASII